MEKLPIQNDSADYQKKKRCLLRTIALLLLIVAFMLVMTGCGKKNQLTTSTLTKALEIDELSTAQFIYNGIAEYTDEQKHVYIKYNASARAGIHISDIKIRVDSENKIVLITLPQIEITDILVDAESFDYMPSNPGLDIRDVMTTCRADIRDEAGYSQRLYDAARENLRTWIELVLKPLVESSGYTIEWHYVNVNKTVEVMK